jgi:hypothetical protein
MSEGTIEQSGHSREALYNILSAALSKRGGMEPDDLLCPRNARPPKALVGRAQWKINQPPSLEETTSELGRIIWDTIVLPQFSHSATELFCPLEDFV